MTRKWLAVFMLIFLALAVVLGLSGCGGGGEGGGGSMISVGGEPEYNWTKRFGGEFSDYGRAVTTDSSGNIYIAGSFTGHVNFAADFGGAETKTSYGNADIFVTRINANGTHEWTKRIGGAGNDGASGIAVDTSGNVYVAGYFESTVDFKVDFGGTEVKTSYGNTTDVFVTKINTNGTYGWTKRIGGTGNDKASGIAVDAYDNVYVAGYFSGSVNFAADFGGEETKASYGNTADIFVTKINANGTHAWTKQMGGAGNDGASGIAVDADDNVYVAGYFEDTVDFKADFGGTESKTSAGVYDAFVTKLSSSDDYFWTKRIGGAEDDWAAGIAVDTSGNVYIAGSFRGEFDFADDFSGGPDQGASNGDEDIFITMLTADGDYGWSRRMGGAGVDAARGIAVDSSGGIYVTGHFEQTVDFRADFGGNNTKTSAGNQDIFITKVSQDGTYGWSRRMGGAEDDYGLGITVNQADVVYMTGFFTGSVNFGSDFGKSTFKYSSGQTDVFLTKITP
jgi:hypothetical protein